jgi:hypothetical protein
MKLHLLLIDAGITTGALSLLENLMPILSCGDLEKIKVELKARL